MRPARFVRAWLAALLAMGCAGSAPDVPVEPAAPADPCLVPTGEPAPAREVIVAIAGPRDSTVVVPDQPQTLIRLDCTGLPRPAAAQSWSADSSRRSWTFRLASAALNAATVAAEWRNRPDAATTLRESGVISVVPLDDERLVVSLDWASDSVPAIFADPSLSIVTDSAAWRVAQFAFRRPASGDLRDALDGGADIVRTGDPELADYARTRADFTVHALPWARTYVLVVPSGREPPGALVSDDPAAARTALARDAVRADARGAEPPYWWEAERDCPSAGDDVPPPPPGNLSDAVVYPAGDAIAEGLAGRIVALSDDARTTAAGIADRVMPAALRAASARAYVVPVSRTPLVPCRVLATWPAGATAVPLIDTRLTAIVRKGVLPLTVDFDGRLRAASSP